MTRHGLSTTLLTMDRQLREYQVDGADWLAPRHVALLADEMGLGKSSELLIGADRAGRHHIVIVGPAVTCQHWMTECNRWVPHWGKLRLTGTKQSDALNQCLTQASFYQGPLCIVLNYDVLHVYERELANWADLVIYDESHYLKNKGEFDSRGSLKGVKRTACAKRLSECVRRRGGYVWLASGTPMPVRPSDLIQQLEIIGVLEAVGGWRHFVERYCDGKQEWITVRGGTRKKVWKYDGHSNLGELRRVLVGGGLMLRRMRRDVMPDVTVMPPGIVPVDLDDSMMSSYESAERDIAEYVWEKALGAALEQGAIDPTGEAILAMAKAQAAEHLVRLSELRKLLGMAKVPGVLEWVKEWREGNPTRKLVLFAHHRAVVEYLHANIESLTLYGGMTDRDRNRAVDTFTSTGDCNTLICNTQAAGIGINLVPCADVVFVEYEWTVAAHRQAADRCARHGQTQPVSVTYLVGSGTIDVDMAERIAEQVQVVDSVFGAEALQGEVIGNILRERKGI